LNSLLRLGGGAWKREPGRITLQSPLRRESEGGIRWPVRSRATAATGLAPRLSVVPSRGV